MECINYNIIIVLSALHLVQAVINFTIINTIDVMQLLIAHAIFKACTLI